MSRFSHRTATEEHWLACADPLRLPKMYPRIGARRRCLVMCAYVLDPVCGFTAPTARAVAEAVRAAVLPVGDADTEGAARAAVRNSVPDYDGTGWWRLSHRAEYKPDGPVLAEFVHECERGPRNNTAINSVAQACLNAVRAGAVARAHAELDRVRQRHFGTDYRARTTEAFKDDVLAMLPTEVSAIVRRDRWDVGVPERVRSKFYAKHSRPAVERAGAALVAAAREVLGNPFRVPHVDPAWREWHGGAVRLIAERAVETWDFAALPVLADALQDAGCEDGYLLAHLRGGPHLPGCWALEAVLGRG